MTVHHLICVAGMTFVLMCQYTANYVVIATFVAEISNPPMHLCKILRNYGLRYSKMYELMEISFLLLYVFVRTFSGIWVCWLVCSCEANHVFLKICALVLMI